MKRVEPTVHYASVFTSHENFIIWIVNSRHFRLRWPIKVSCFAHEDVTTLQQLMRIIFGSSRGRVRQEQFDYKGPKGVINVNSRTKTCVQRFPCICKLFQVKNVMFCLHNLHVLYKQTSIHENINHPILTNKSIFLAKSRLTKDCKYLI